MPVTRREREKSESQFSREEGSKWHGFVFIVFGLRLCSPTRTNRTRKWAADQSFFSFSLQSSRRQKRRRKKREFQNHPFFGGLALAALAAALACGRRWAATAAATAVAASAATAAPEAILRRKGRDPEEERRPPALVAFRSDEALAVSVTAREAWPRSAAQSAGLAPGVESFFFF